MVKINGIPEGFKACRATIRKSGEPNALIVNAYISEKSLVVEEQEGFYLDSQEELDDDDPRLHNCDDMGCGQCHVMLTIDFSPLGATR